VGGAAGAEEGCDICSGAETALQLMQMSSTFAKKQPTEFGITKMTMTYHHLVEIDEQKRLLTIYRIMESKRVLFTSTGIPPGKWKGNSRAMKRFCQMLDENIILDSPQARRLLEI
jgi:hypothetical protein